MWNKKTKQKLATSHIKAKASNEEKIERNVVQTLKSYKPPKILLKFKIFVWKKKCDKNLKEKPGIPPFHDWSGLLNKSLKNFLRFLEKHDKCKNERDIL